MQARLIIHILITCLGLSLRKVGVLAKMLGLQLSLKGLVRGLGVDGLLLKDRQDAHWLLKELKAGGKIHAKVASDPDNTLTHVLLLLQNEHSVVEELKDSFVLSASNNTAVHLLKLLIDKVDTDLFKGVKLEDLEAGDVQHTNEGDLLHGWVLGKIETGKVFDKVEEKPNNRKA